MMGKKDFVLWCNSNDFDKNDVNLHVYLNYDGNKPGTPNLSIVSKFSDIEPLVNNALNKGKSVKVEIEGKTKVLDDLQKFDFQSSSGKRWISKLAYRGYLDLEIVHGWIGSMEIVGGSRGLILIDTCQLGELVIKGECRLSIAHSNIGSLKISHAVKGLEIISSNLFNIETSDKITNGDVHVDLKSWFPIKTRANSNKSLLSNINVYSKLRKELHEAGNIAVSGYFYVRELRASRQCDTWTALIFNYLYDFLSVYGTSIKRPLIIFVLLFAFTSYTAYQEDAVMPADKECKLQGWQEQICKSDKTIMALTLATQSILNPGGIISPKSLVVTKLGTFTNVWIWLHSAFSITLFTLFIFSLRRRFKVQDKD